MTKEGRKLRTSGIKSIYNQQVRRSVAAPGPGHQQ